MFDNEDSMKIKEQTRNLGADSSKHCFEVADKTNQVNYRPRARRRWLGLKRFPRV